MPSEKEIVAAGVAMKEGGDKTLTLDFVPPPRYAVRLVVLIGEARKKAGCDPHLSVNACVQKGEVVLDCWDQRDPY